jgi:hypothetical protein
MSTISGKRLPIKVGSTSYLKIIGNDIVPNTFSKALTPFIILQEIP